jgi:hypothetical protein
MTECYKTEDLDRFAEVGRHNPTFFSKFTDWYNAALEPGVLIKREKVQIDTSPSCSNSGLPCSRRLPVMTAEEDFPL